MYCPELVEGGERVIDFEGGLEFHLVPLDVGFVESDEGDIFVQGRDCDFGVSAFVEFDRLQLVLLSESAVWAGSPA
jgi:hypothetical protein